MMRSVLFRDGLILSLVLAGALVVRLAGIDFLLPHIDSPDPYVEGLAQKFAAADESGQTSSLVYSKYPHLSARILSLYQSFVETGESIAARALLREQLDFVAGPMRRGRILFAILSLLIIPGTWYLTRRVSGNLAAHLAAFLVAFSLLHITTSQLVRPHGLAAALSVLSICAALRVRRGVGVPGYLVAGLLTALAIGTLHFGFFLLPPLLVAHVLRATRPRGRWLWMLSLLPILLVIPACYPWLFEAVRSPDGVGWLGAHDFATLGQVWQPVHCLNLPGYLLAADPLLFFVALLALPILWFCRKSGPDRTPRGLRGDLLVILAYVVPFVIVVGGVTTSQARFVVPLLPYVCCLAAAGIGSLTNWIMRSSGSALSRYLSCGIVLVVMVVPPVLTAVRLANLQRRPDTLELAARWARRHARPAQDLILVGAELSLPLVTGTERTRWVDLSGHGWLTSWESHLLFQSVLPHNRRWWTDKIVGSDGGHLFPPTRRKQFEDILDSRMPRFVIVSSSNRRSRRLLLPVLRERGRLVRDIPCVALRGPELAFMGFQDADMCRRVWFGLAWGPSLEIYRMNGPPPDDGEDRPREE